MAVMDTIDRLFNRRRDEEDIIDRDEYDENLRDEEYFEGDDFEGGEEEPARGGFSFSSLFGNYRGSRGTRSRASRYTDGGYEGDPVEEDPRNDSYGGSSYSGSSYGGSSYSSYSSHKKDPARIVLVRATRFAEVKRVAENLKQDRSIVVNFEDMERGEAQRTMDFLSGTTFAKGGDVQKLSKSTYIFAVGPVDLIGSIERKQATDEYFSI